MRNILGAIWQKNSNVPRPQEDHINHVSEEIEGRVTKKLSEEFSSTENSMLGSLARFDDFLMNSLIQGHSATDPSRILPGTHVTQTRERMMTTPRVILIVKHASSRARQRETLAQKTVTTVVLGNEVRLTFGCHS